VSEDRRILDEILAASEFGRPVVLATIVRAKGSTPRGVGSRMLVDPVRGSIGTIGGGCGEAEVMDAARHALEDGRARLVRVELTDDVYSFSPAVCGGIFDVLLEPVGPSSAA
jgi:xanthine dehydrogenase accessory factor